TTRGWFDELPDYERQRVSNYLKLRDGERSKAAPALMDVAWSSAAALSIAPLQDLLNLGKEARMNIPGRPEGNWRWRSTENMVSDKAFEWLRNLTKKSNRLRPSRRSETGKTLAAVMRD